MVSINNNIDSIFNNTSSDIKYYHTKFIILKKVKQKYYCTEVQKSKNIYTVLGEKLFTKRWRSDISITSRKSITNITWISERWVTDMKMPEGKFIATVKVGEKVITDKYAGTKVTLEDVEYIIVKQADILAIVE